MIYLALLLFFVFDYLMAGAVYMMYFQMLTDGEDWDNVIWLTWPLMAWRRWMLHRYIERQHKKWDNY